MCLPHLQIALGISRRVIVRLTAVLVIAGTLFFLSVEPSPSIPKSHQNNILPSSISGLYDSSSIRQYLVSSSLKSFITESQYGGLCTPGYLFLVLDGHSPTIVDQSGELVWLEKRTAVTQNLRVQSYRGQDYLTYWTKEPTGSGSYHMLDSSYSERHIISPVGNISDTLHDFTVTHRDTAIISAHYTRRANLSTIGGPADGWILDGMFQEIDIITGRLVFQWRAAEHVPIKNTMKTLEYGEGTEDHPFDYFHINSVDEGPSGDYLVSAGNIRTVMSISQSTGQIQWSLGGPANILKDLGDRSAVDFSWPYNARWIGNETVIVMDSGENQPHELAAGNRGISIYVNSHTRQAALQQVYSNPMGSKTHFEGDLKASQSTGTVPISWGEHAGFSEFNANGEALCSFYFPESQSWVASSGISKHTWTGKPLSKPIAKVSGHRLYAYWNGATKVAGWQLLVKSYSPVEIGGPPRYHEIGRYKKTGYETPIMIPRLKGGDHSFRIAALDRQGSVLGYTEAVKWQQAWTGSDLSQSQFRILAGVCLFSGVLVALSTLHIRLKHRDRGELLLPTYETLDWKTNRASIISNLGLTTTNHTSAFLLWNWAYAYLLLSTRPAKARAGIDHNASPRYDLVKYGERAVTEGKITRKRLQQIQRLQSAHENSVEGFAFFAASIVLMNVAKLDAETVNSVGVWYSLSRIAYGLAYYYIEDFRWSFLRSVLWHSSNFSCIAGIWWAGKSL